MEMSCENCALSTRCDQLVTRLNELEAQVRSDPKGKELNMSDKAVLVPEGFVPVSKEDMLKAQVDTSQAKSRIVAKLLNGNLSGNYIHFPSGITAKDAAEIERCVRGYGHSGAFEVFEVQEIWTKVAEVAGMFR